MLDTVKKNPKICFVETSLIDGLHDRILKLESELCNSIQQIELLQKECEEFNKRRFTLDKIKDDEDAVIFYTGFPNYNSLISFYLYLEPKLNKLQYWKGEKSMVANAQYHSNFDKKKPGPPRKLNHLEELFMVLLRVKVGLFVEDLADRFTISTGLVSEIVITWIILLYFELKLLFPYPSQDLIRANMPLEFMEYATTRIILDCTEVFIQRPSAMLSQSQTWSDYKHHNTLKALIGISPNGQVTYVSKLWGGRASDKLIVKECGILEMLEPGDNVMVDRGFEIDDIVPPGVSVNMPPFLGSRQQLTAVETEKTMKIASLRIHVERAIGRIKTYHILDGNVPLSLSPYANQIFTVCSLLTNFLPPLLSKQNNS